MSGKIHENRRAKSGGTHVATPSAAAPPRQSKAALCCSGAPIEEKTRSNSGPPLLCRRVATLGASVEKAPPLLHSRVALRAPNKENTRRTKQTSTAVPPDQSKVAICGSEATIKEKASSKSRSTQAAASSMAPALHQSRVPMSVSGVSVEEKRTKSLMPKPPRRTEVALSANGRPVDGVVRADVIEYGSTWNSSS
ncbi:hypothetical protein ZWY2020_035002 [Hordeum vulgare]|nr:hypothetical protein ZWY2020_035002 [Hordeum vulgare]